MINLSALKKSSSKDLLAKLQKQVTTADTKKIFEKDTRMWNPSTDAAGNGTAVIRFLPAANDNNLPYVKLYAHGFKIGSKWFIDNCPSTLTKQDDCPVCLHIAPLWDGTEAEKSVAQQRKRKTNYYANVLVVKDPANPENEGQVKIYRFGQKIFDKIKEAINPDIDSGDEAIDPFNFFDGANFLIKIAQIGGFKNYDKSKFASASELYEGDETKLRVVLEQLHDIDALVAEDQFKSTAELQKKYDLVIGAASSTGSVSVKENEEFEQVKNSKPAAEKVVTPPAADESDDLAYFQALARGEV